MKKNLLITPCVLFLSSLLSVFLIIQNIIDTEKFDKISFANGKVIINNGEKIINLFENIRIEFFFALTTIFLMIVLLYYFWDRANFIECLTICKKITLSNKTILIVSLSYTCLQLLPFLSNIFVSDFADKAIKNHSQKILIFVSVSFVIPIIEEVLFRGFLFHAISKYFEKANYWVPISIVSLLFAISHVQYSIPVMVLLGLMSFILTYLRHKSNSIFPSIFLHSLNNTLATVAVLI